ncbi:hypothetical protein KM043_006274 [Ampulex compressa]|nr:hypothetical protein KM043_006274 [Ampulex compressa]
MAEPAIDDNEAKELSPEDRAFAAAILNENDADRAAKIAEIKEWILKTEEMHARMDDFFILRFLRACKFDVEKTKWKFKNYHRQRFNQPEWFGKRDPFLPEMQEMLSLGVFLPLRKLDDEGRMIVVVRAAVHNPMKHKQADVLKASMMALDLAIRDNELVTLHGIVAIIDLQGVTLGHALQLTPGVIKNLVHSWQGCYPLRIQSIDFVNAPSYVNVVLKIFKGFMNNKLKRRLHVHTRGMQAFCQKLPKDILPLDYGGVDGTLDDLIEYWKKTVEDNREWLADDENYKMVDRQ